MYLKSRNQQSWRHNKKQSDANLGVKGCIYFITGIHLMEVNLRLVPLAELYWCKPKTQRLWRIRSEISNFKACLVNFHEMSQKVK